MALAGCVVVRGPTPRTGLERANLERPSTPDEIVRFLQALAHRRPESAFVTIGRSAGGRPLGALLLGQDVARDCHGDREEPCVLGERRALSTPDTAQPPQRLTVMLVGSQHGTEPSGGEALQVLARDIASGARPTYLADLSLILVPDANPDGRAAHRRVNARGVNLSTDYAAASQPETRAILDAMARWHPDVVLDVHESAIFKHRSLGAQGYLTDFETQIELATNPNVEAGLTSLGERLLAEAVARVEAAGVRAQRYIGEITDVRQPITHGGLSVNNFRNMAGMGGALSFLLENRLDPPAAAFATPHNIRVRVQKQMVGITALLDTCRAHRAEILEAVAAARDRWRRADDLPLHLLAGYGTDATQPEIIVALRRTSDGELEPRPFPLHDVVERHHTLRHLPLAYVVTAHQDLMSAILARHGIACRRLAEPRDVTAGVLRITSRGAFPAGGLHTVVVYDVAARRERITAPAGALWIPLDQPARRLIPLLLEPESDGNVLQDPELRPLVQVGADLFVSRVWKAPR